MQNDVSNIHSYLAVLRRRKWILLQALVLLPAAAIALSLTQKPLYQASAEVLLNRQNLAATLGGLSDQSVFQDPARIAQTQADLARSPEVAERTLRALGTTGSDPQKFLGASDVVAKPDADLLDFKVTYGNPVAAVRMASEYARQFTIYRREIDTFVLERTRRSVQGRIRELQGSGDTRSPLYASLVDKEQQLRTLEALQASNVLLSRPASTAAQIQPRPLRNGVLGLFLGLALGIGLAFLANALDTRVRSADEVSQRLGLPLLARLPEPPRKLRNKDRLVMIEEPNSLRGEGFRLLRTNLEFANLEREAKSIMVTSAVEREGKTTTIANLAVALARTGRSVTLLDLDLRRPLIARLFGIPDRPGLTDVALGHADLQQAVIPIAVGVPPSRDGGGRKNGNAQARIDATLNVVGSGPLPPNPGEFVGSRTLAHILQQLEEGSEIVLIDAPPLLHVGDAMVLSGIADALFIVTRLNLISRPMLAELERVLETIQALKLGFVVTGAEGDQSYGYGAYDYYRPRAPSERVS